MKYFLHDSNAFNDEKITELYINFGYEGVGLYYTILEKLALQEKPVKTIVLKKQLNIGKKLQKCLNFMEEIELVSSNNGETFSKTLLNFSQKYQIKKEKNTKRIKQWRENQAIKENVTRYKSVRNSPKVNRSKVNRSKYKETLLSELKNSDVDNEMYFDATIAFWKLFISNLEEKNISTEKIKKAKGKWIDSIRLLIEIDKYTSDDLRDVFKFLQIDEFWKKNILSTSKLREKFETLLINARTDETRNRKAKCTTFELAEIVGKHFATNCR